LAAVPVTENVSENFNTKLHSDGLGFYSQRVNELEELWAAMVRERIDEAGAAGRTGASDYLTLRETNDAIRRIGVQWLIDAVVEAALSPDRPALKVERTEPHQFSLGGGRATGVCVTVSFGVRRFTAEAGWARTPADGFIRGGGLAVARFTHFGIPKEGRELKLACIDGVPTWLDAAPDAPNAALTADGIRRHIALLSEH
jgi:hypothetical protein